MAKVSFRKQLQVSNISPGQVHGWRWQNAPSKRVWQFSLDPIPHGNNIYETYRLEIIRVENRLITYWGGSSKREVVVYVRNNGDSPIGYIIYQATIRA